MNLINDSNLKQEGLRLVGSIFYFSGTGNSRFVAEKFVYLLNNKYKHDFKAYSIEEKLDFITIIDSMPIIGFCYPIYGSSVPTIMKNFVEKYKNHLENKKIVILSTQLIFSGDGARVFTDLLEGISVEVILAEHFNMPNNLCNVGIFKVKNGDENIRTLLKAEKKINSLCKAFEENKKILRGFNGFSRLMGLTQRIPYKNIEQKAADKVFVDDKKCILCEKCIKECPMSNLYISQNKVISNGICTLCYRCVNNCPQKAINVWLKRKVKKQYLGL